jgi:hypothetical protein
MLGMDVAAGDQVEGLDVGGEVTLLGLEPAGHREELLWALLAQGVEDVGMVEVECHLAADYRVPPAASGRQSDWSRCR